MMSYWYDNGQIWMQENYKMGKKHGLMIGWYKNGKEHTAKLEKRP